MTEEWITEFSDTLRRKGFFFALVELCDKAGVPVAVNAVVDLASGGALDVLGAMESDVDNVDWKKDGWRIEHWFSEFLLKVPTLDVERLLDTVESMSRKRMSDDSLLAYYVGRYFDHHGNASETAASLILGNDKYERFVIAALPRAIRENPSRWSSALLLWIQKRTDVNSRIDGMAAFAAVDATVVAGIPEPIVAQVLDLANAPFSWQDPGRYLIVQYRLCKLWACRANGFLVVISKLLASGNKNLLSQVALTEMSDLSQQDDAVIEERLKAFLNCLKTDDGYFDSVDAYLENLVARSTLLVVDFIAEVLSNTKREAGSREEFGRTFDAIANSQGDTRDVVVTRWLASDNKCLWLAASRLVGESRSGQDLGIVASEQELPANRAARVNFVRRSMGFLLSAHVTCVGFVISCLTYLDNGALSYIANDFYDVITMNFTDLVDVYIKSHSNADKKVLDFLKSQLARRKKLEEALSRANDINEVYPPLDNRLEFSKIKRLENKKIYESAMSQSILSALTTRVTILFGNGMITETHIDGESRRTEVPMEQTTTRIRVPGLMYSGEITLQSKIDELRYMEVSEL